MPYTREIYQLNAREHVVASRLLVSLPAADPSPILGYMDTYVWDLSAHDDGLGNLLIMWRYSRNDTESINLLRVNGSGEVKHEVVKEFRRHEPFFSLRAFVLQPDFVQFFYTNYSEKYFSLSDTGSIEKLWTLGWREGKIVFDTQLSERGRAHTTRYDAWHSGNGRFEVTWTDRRSGTFFGPRQTFKLGSLAYDAEKPRLRTITDLSIDDLADDLVYPIAVPNGKDGAKAIAAIYAGNKGAFLAKVYPSGKRSGQINLEGRDIGELVYDPHTALFRYVKGRVHSGLRTERATKAEVRWTDLEGNEWAEQLQVPVGSVFPGQPAGDCFYWLQPAQESYSLLKKCRSPSRSGG